MFENQTVNSNAGSANSDEPNRRSTAQAGERTTVSPPDVSWVDVPERAEDRRAARRMHRKRFVIQILGWGFKILLAAACVPLLNLQTLHLFASCGSNLPMNMSCRFVMMCAFAMPMVLIGLFAVNLYYQHDSKHNWKVAKARAKEFADPEEVAKGWTTVFSIYVRTKRRCYHVLGWGLIAVLYAVTNAAFLILDTIAGPGQWLYWLPPVLEFALGIALLRLAYVFGSWYLPGDVIVRHTLALIIHAVTNINDPNMARRAAAQGADRFVYRNPWWFYER